MAKRGKTENPKTTQNIREKAGLITTALNPSFYVTSIKKFSRKERLAAVKEWIDYLKKTEEFPLFVVLDVVTDCVESFNKDTESLELFDFLGNLCDDYGATFLLLIHENHGTEKARGHTGSEATNKASCVMQISFEEEKTGLLKLKFIKLRGAARPQPIFLEYSPAVNGLVLAPDEVVQQALEEKRKTAHIEAIKEQLEVYLEKPMAQKDLCVNLQTFFSCSENTIKSRLKRLIEGKDILHNAEGIECVLAIQWQMGKTATYYLKPCDEPILFQP